MNIPDTPEADAEPVQTAVDVTVKNTGESELTGVSVARELKLSWDVDDVKAPEPLPLVQNGAPEGGTARHPGRRRERDRAVPHLGQGRRRIRGTRHGKRYDDERQDDRSGKGRVKVRAPLLFFYAHRGREVRSPDARKLVAAGTAFAIGSGSSTARTGTRS